MLTIMTLLACGEPEPEWVPPERPSLVLEGKVIEENLPAPGKTDFYHFSMCPMEHLVDALGYPLDPSDCCAAWTRGGYTVAVGPRQDVEERLTNLGCTIQIYRHD